MTKYQVRGLVCCISILLAAQGLAWAQTGSRHNEARMTVSQGKEVSLEYTLRLENKEVVDSNVGKDPLTYTQGTQQIIPGLEAALEGMVIGQSKQVAVAPEKGYGAIDPKAFQEVPKEQIPAEALKVGVQLRGQDPSGRVVSPRIAEIKQDTVVLDFNHPLAGKTLYFDVKVVEIKAGSTKDN